MVPDHTRGAHPTASGRLKTVVLFRQSYPALTNGGVDNAVVPCGTGALVTQSALRTLSQLSTTWARDFHIKSELSPHQMARPQFSDGSMPGNFWRDAAGRVWMRSFAFPGTWVCSGEDGEDIYWDEPG